ncbi:MAG: hypothetical protein LBL44_10715 [Treponema sp.]|jgi:hypothetical protein|nr:hypothetical protein [Treponema sp.]
MTPLKSGIDLLENESLTLEIDAELYITSRCAVLRFLQGIIRFFAQILGFRKRGFLVVTNKRVVEIYNQIIFWIINIRKYVNSVPLCKIDKEVDYVKKGTFAFLFRAYQLYYQRSWRRVYVILRGLDEKEVHQVSNAVYKTLEPVQ